MLPHFSDLGWKYIYSKNRNIAFEQTLTTDVKVMYSDTAFART
jgi:hypothetical protein